MLFFTAKFYLFLGAFDLESWCWLHHFPPYIADALTNSSVFLWLSLNFSSEIWLDVLNDFNSSLDFTDFTQDVLLLGINCFEYFANYCSTESSGIPVLKLFVIAFFVFGKKFQWDFNVKIKIHRKLSAIIAQFSFQYFFRYF